ncbi:MAG: serine hydrolase, partial [Deltaproteobacteria bacterium]|nr:serine hydrolase [Deltaproteobacteria bacterium]
MTHVDRLMKDAVLNDVFPGGVLLVSLDGATVFFEAYGSANLFAGRQMTKET